MTTIKDFEGIQPAWCPGCGNFAILNSIKKALVELGKNPHELLLVSGIGQASKLPHYLKCNVFNGLHGRPIPSATGAKVANPDLVVIAIAGDGDCYGEGGNHFIHAIRRNVNITVLVHDNQVYGLTKGQASPTSDLGFVTKIQHEGVILTPFNPIAIAVALDASFVARSFAGDIEHLSKMIQEAVKHKGFAVVDILQPCVTFNKLNTFQWYKQRVYKIGEGDGYDPTNRLKAFEKSLEWGEKIPIGIIYKKERSTFEEQIPALKKGPLVKHKLNPKRFQNLLESFL